MVLIVICERSSNGAISAGMLFHKTKMMQNVASVNTSAIHRLRKKAASERLYRRFIPSKKGSVLR